MTVELISFTENGGRLAAALAAGLERSGHRAACTRKGERAEEWTAAAFRRAERAPGAALGWAGVAPRAGFTDCTPALLRAPATRRASTAAR